MRSLSSGRCRYGFPTDRASKEIVHRESFTMSAPETETCDKHPFGGCNRLLSHYQTVGEELLCVESRGGIGSFREGVAFVPVEVLESYLEDLLDLGVKEETLYIHRESHWFRSWQILVLGLMVALGAGLYAASIGASLLVSFGLTALLSVPFGFFFHLTPKIGLIRRMSFAQVLSAEISRRRGRDRDGDSAASRNIFREVLGGSQRTPLQGAAKKLYH